MANLAQGMVHGMSGGRVGRVGGAWPTPGYSDAAVIGFGLMILVLVGGGLLGVTSTRRLAENEQIVAHTHEVIGELETLVSALKDAETGHRGYLLTGDDAYLGPHRNAVRDVPAAFARLENLTSDNPAQQARLAVIRPKIERLLAELGRSIALKKAGDQAAAMEVVRTNAGKAMMDALRDDIAAMRDVENDLLRTRGRASTASFRTTIMSILTPAVIGLGLLVLVFVLNRRHQLTRDRAKARFAEQAERLRTTLASIGDGVITTDTAGHVTNMNGVAESLTGWSNADAVGVPLAMVFKIVNESTRREVANPAFRALHEGIIVGLANHTLLIAKDGPERPIDDSAAPIRNQAGEVVGSVLVFRDVTERRAGEVAQAERTRLASLRAEVATALSTDRPAQVTLQNCAEALVRHLDVAFARIWTLDDTESVLELQASAGLYTHRDGPHGRIPVGQYKIGRIAGSRQPHLTNDVPNDPNVSDPAWAEREGMVAFAGYPFQVDGRVYGVAAVFARRPLADSAVADLAHLADGLAQYTARKRAERIAHEARVRLDASLEAAEVGTWQFDVVQNVVRADANLVRMFGVTPADAAGGSLDAYTRAVHPDDRGRVAEAIQKALEAGDGYEVEYRLAAPGGVVHWVIARGRVVRDTIGRAIQLPGVVVDITQRKLVEDQLRESEARRRLALDSAELGSWHVDPVTNHLESDERFRTIFHGSPEPLTYDQAFAAIHPADRQRVREAVAAATRPDDPAAYAEEYRVVHPDGTSVWVLGQGRANFEDAGAGRRLVSFDGTVADVSERRRMENDLRQLAADLSEADRRKDVFLATLAHELRNPLAPLRNAVQVLRLAGDRADAVGPVVGLMERQLGQMVRLVDDLLDVSRISRGTLDLRTNRVDLAAVIESAVETSRPLIDLMGHELAVTLPDPPVVVEADPTRLAQVFMNLLNNAAKYSERAGRIWLVADRRDGGVVVSVRDTGVGIPADKLGGVFDLFSQVDGTSTLSQGGLGIGLSLVKRLVEMHGGEIEARSAGPGRGSEFVVRLPVVADPSTPRPAVSDKPAAVTSLRILVVDDNRDGADSLAMMLGMFGGDTRTAYDGLAGVDAAEQFRPDVALFDIGLPKLNGYEACRRIRQQTWGKGVVLIAVTGWGQDEDRRRSHDAGFDHHLVKPVDPQNLMELLSVTVPVRRSPTT